MLLPLAKSGFGAETLPARMDGTKVEAVESYLNNDANRISIGLGSYPFNPYFNGFSLSGGYTYNFSKTTAWEMIHAAYVHTVDTGLTSELADDYDVTPDRIEKLKFSVMTNGSYVFSYGKFLLLDKHIRYFRASLLYGGGLLSTTVAMRQAINLGIRTEFHMNNFLSWVFEFRDAIVVTNGKTYPSFTIGFAGSY